MLSAWRALRRLKRQELADGELPVAQLCCLMANVNRDPKKAPFELDQFRLFKVEEKREVGAGLSPEVAAVALQLQADGEAPDLLLAVWPEVLRAAEKVVAVPERRLWRTDDGAVWVLAPVREGSGVRGGLVLVSGGVSGVVRLRDVDRPLLVMDVRMPRKGAAHWVEGGLLLAGA